jgi:PKD repeat protein
VSQSTYPWQFKVIEYPSTWGVSKYGPNRYRNEKVHHILQSVSARFDDKDTSTYIPRNNTSPDSNQIGFFTDPQDFHNKDVVRYFGNHDFMDDIGDPMNQYSSSYQALNIYRKQYATSLNEYSGSRTLFNELITLYKLYFNRSIFEAIKNVVPARSNTLVGVLIEPSILERPKYPLKPIFSEANTGSVFYGESTAAHYFRDPNTKLCRITESLLYADFNLNTSSLTNFNSSSMPNNLTIDLNMAYINLPNRTYPFNYLPGGTYIGDTEDNYQLGHFAGGVMTDPELIIPPPPIVIVPVTADFVADLTSGVSPFTVHFTNLSTNASSYQWDFGDGNTSTDVNPTHIYTLSGIYTVTLNASSGEQFDAKIRSSYITVILQSIPCGNPVQYTGHSVFPYQSSLIDLGNGTGTVTFNFDSFNIPDKYLVIINNAVVANTGYVGQNNITQQNALNTALLARGLPSEPINQLTNVVGHYGSGSISFSKTSDQQYAMVEVYAPIAATAWNFTLLCPV